MLMCNIVPSLRLVLVRGDMSVLKEYIGRILLHFDMRYNFIDSNYLRKNLQLPSGSNPREYWATTLFWKGIKPDKKFELSPKVLGGNYHFGELVAFALFKLILNFLGSVAQNSYLSPEGPTVANSSRLEFSQLIHFFETRKSSAFAFHANSYSENDFVIVIPVFNAAEYVEKCVKSVLETTQSCEILIINDSSTDHRTLEFLTKLSTNNRIRIIDNEANLGFVRSANIGFKNSYGKHVLLLNSDTVVFPNWLNRIAYYFNLDRKAWTVTPFSNAATIFSMPFPTETPLDLETSRLLDQFLSQDILRASVTISAPTCHGFCVAIHKDALNSLGGFNEDDFGRGYGEENEFSMRVKAAGFKNVIATNTLVHHFGSKSFGKENLELSKANMQKLLNLHPSYLQEVKLFLRGQPFDTIRALSLIHLSRIKTFNSRLVISHALGGGVDKSIALENEDFQGLLVVARPKTQNSITIEFTFASSRETLEIIGIESSNLLQSIFDLFQPGEARIDHILGFPAESIERFNSKSHNYSVRLHDYIYVCPKIHLSGTDNRDCNLPDISTCSSCLSDDFEIDIDISTWRIRNISFLLQSHNLLASCEDVKSRYRRVNGNLSISVSPVDIAIETEFSPIFKALDDDITICVLGHLNLNKGFRNVNSLAQYLRDTSSSMKIAHIGNLIGGRIRASKNFCNYGEYQDTFHLYSILKEINPDIFWFPAEVPETFSYTLSEVLPFGIPISYFDIGAIGERLQNYEWRVPLRIASEPSEISNSMYQSVMNFREINHG